MHASDFLPGPSNQISAERLRRKPSGAPERLRRHPGRWKGSWADLEKPCLSVGRRVCLPATPQPLIRAGQVNARGYQNKTAMFPRLEGGEKKYLKLQVCCQVAGATGHHLGVFLIRDLWLSTTESLPGLTPVRAKRGALQPSNTLRFLSRLLSPTSPSQKKHYYFSSPVTDVDPGSNIKPTSLLLR